MDRNSRAEDGGRRPGGTGGARARRVRGAASGLAIALFAAWAAVADASDSIWPGFAGNAQHSAISAVASQSLGRIRWQTPVDLKRQYGPTGLETHYGSPAITAANTVIVPVKVGADGIFRVEARRAGDRALQWSLYTDYLLPPHSWTPSFNPVLTQAGRLYFPAAGGTLLFRDTPDERRGATGRVAFYGIENFQPNWSALFTSVRINTPLTADSLGNIYFGFQVVGTAPLDLVSGIARVDKDGVGTWIGAAAAAGSDPTITKVVNNAAPALSNDEKTVYVMVTDAVLSDASPQDSGSGYLVALDSATLAPVSRARLKDVLSGEDARLSESGTASPTVGPDGDVYVGVLENPPGANHGRGWLLHFDASLGQSKLAGAFGWDQTASVVPASAVPSYSGPSAYLLATNYNNSVSAGGDGVNKLAILDPGVSALDPISGAALMHAVLTITGPTPTGQFPNAVSEWCTNTAVVDPATKSVLAKSLDGKLYRWSLASNTLSQSITLSGPFAEACTPTLVGPDGTVYAISLGILFAVGQ